MYIRYGTYTHSLGEAAVFISREPVETDAKTTYAVRERWDIQGMLPNPTGVLSDMSAAVNALEVAYAYGGYDLTLLLPDGTNSQHLLDSSRSIGGTRVVKPLSYPDGTGAEYVTMRTFNVSIEAMIPISGPTNLLSFHETLAFAGGGSQYGHLEPLAGMPVRQLLKRNTVYKVTQHGRAVGLYSYPITPYPIWPAYLLQTPDITRGTPRRIGFGGAVNYTEFPIEWSYKFESPLPLSGNPSRWVQ